MGRNSKTSTSLKTSAPCQSRFCFGNLASLSVGALFGRLHQFWWPARAMGTHWRSWLRFGALCLLASFAFGANWLDEVKRDAKGNITEVNLRHSWVSDSDLLALAQIPTITKLDLAETRITDLGFQHLKKLPAVTDVNLYYAELLGDEALAAMKTWKNLKTLNARGTKITDAGLANLAGLPIESIDVGYSLFTDGGFEHLAALPKLTSIAVGGNKVTDVGLNTLRTMPNLISVDLSGAQRTDSGLWAATVTDRGLESLARLPKLQRLNLHGAKITDAGAGQLRTLQELRELNLGATQLSAKGLGFLAELGKLEKLSLPGLTKLDDEAIPVLAAMKSLRWLDITDTKITPEGAERLRTGHPGLVVLATKKSQ
jgi:Leucine-rich repeat (LRR) protein